MDQLLSDEQLLPSTSGGGAGREGYDLSTPGTRRLPLTDNVGTVRDLAICDLTSGTTSVVNHLDYNSFGQLLSQTNPATGNTAAVDCLFGFTGLPFDKASGTYRTTQPVPTTRPPGGGWARTRTGSRRGHERVSVRAE